MQLMNHRVRDLAWACFSQPLMITPEIADDLHNVANCGLALTDARKSRLAALDHDPSPLNRFLGEDIPRRLGLYFEKLWHFFLQDDPDIELLAHNLPVRQGGKTLGEFDCLYFCHQRQRNFHLELAVKYYLGNPAATSPASQSPWSAWIGPNARDRLDLKLSRLLNHQARLSDTEAGQETLSRMSIDSPVAEAEVKGWLYQPAEGPIPLPLGFNPARSTGLWVKQGGLREFLDARPEALRWQVLPRQAWLSTASGSPPPLEKNALEVAVETHFQQMQQPLQIAALELDSGGWKETNRVFIVSEHWPDLPR